MKIIFYLKNGHNFETFWCSEKDVIRLASQFNNGHLMRVKKLYINPKELISFVVCDDEEKMMIGDERMVEVNCRKYETLTIGLEDDNWEYLKNGGELLFPCKEINRVIVLKHR